MVSQDTEGSRQRILRAAEKEFAQKGFNGARVDRVATQAGVNKALLYYYFKSKAGLLEAMFEDFFLQLRTAKEQVALPEAGPQDDYWRRIVREIFAVTRQRLDLLRVVLLEELKGDRENDRIVRRWRTEWESAFAAPGDAEPRPDQAVFNFFFEDLNMMLFLLLNEKWSAAMDRDPRESEELYFELVRVQSDAYWARSPKKAPHVD